MTISVMPISMATRRQSVSFEGGLFAKPGSFVSGFRSLERRGADEFHVRTRGGESDGPSEAEFNGRNDKDKQGPIGSG